MKVNLIYPGEKAFCNWILGKMGNELASRIDFANVWRSPGNFGWKYRRGEIEIRRDEINYFIDHTIFVKTKVVGGAWFTHPESDGVFESVGKQADFSVVTAEQYKMESNSFLIYPGIDPMYQPKIVLGFVGRTYEGGRKGDELLEKVSCLPFVELKRTDGKYKKEELPGFYQSLDYVLVTSRVEGGPLCLLEGAAMGKKTICPLDVGLAREFASVVIPYENSDWESLLNVLTMIYDEKQKIAETVSRHTWDSFAEEHMRVFESVHHKCLMQL